jgi:hypothetical protein
MKQVKQARDMNVIERLQAPTPKFFKKLRTAGLMLAAAGGVLVAAPIALPTLLVAIGGYLLVAGSIATAVSQVAVEEPEINKKKDVMTESLGFASR